MYKYVKGDLFSQEVECFVNSWNMNYIPWFLLMPHGVSGRLKKLGGYKPFNELLKKGILSPGEAVLTSGGRLPQHIIHVAGLKWYWVSSTEVVEKCTINALILAKEHDIKSIAFPLIGSGVGGVKPEEVKSVMEKVIKEANWGMDIVLVEYDK
jgi:O-acetyl-ADP-ribose deacetylase